MNALKDGWFSELSDPSGDGGPAASWSGQAFSLEVKEILFHEKSAFQDVLVFKRRVETSELQVTFVSFSKANGVVLVLDGPTFRCFAHPNPQNVLVIGGGDGGVVREALKHPTVRRIVLCEIDELVVKVAKRFLPEVSVGLEDERVEVVIADALEYLKEHSNQFDVIITDLSDPSRPLRPNGIVAAQGECPWIDLPFISQLFKTCTSLFPQVRYATSSVPTYTSGLMGFLLCSLNADSDVRVPNRKDEKLLHSMDLKFYNFELHKAAFELSNQQSQ
ncbi:Spermidine synthase [Aphelenchoides fujianensis]|nr:Spermidine synthase [Aphelenchoides fujianensis]